MIWYHGVTGFRPIILRIKLTWNNLQWRIYFSWIIDIPYAILNMTTHMDKNDKLVWSGNFPSGCNVHNISFYYDFSLVRHSIRTFRGMNEKMQSIIVKSSPGPWFNIKLSSYQYRKSDYGDKTILRPSYLHNGVSYTGKMTSLYWIRVQGVCMSSVPCKPTLKWIGCFFCYRERPSDWNIVWNVLHIPVKLGNMSIRNTWKLLVWSTSAFKSSWCFLENDLIQKILFTGVAVDTGVNTCLDYACNGIAVQSEALILTNSFTLKQVTRYCKLTLI